MKKIIDYYYHKFLSNDIRMDYKWHNKEFYQFIHELKRIAKNKGLAISPLTKEATIHGGKRLPKGLSHLLSEFDPYPYVTGASCLDNLSINFDKCSRINNLIYDKVKCRNLVDEDILVSIAGTIGRLGFFNSSSIDLDADVQNKAKFSENVALIRKKQNSNILPRNLLYYLNSPLGQIQFYRMYGGSEQYKLSLSLLNKTIIVFHKQKRDQEQMIKEISKIYNKSVAYRKKYYEGLGKIEKTIQSHLPIAIPRESHEYYFKQFSLNGDRIDYSGNHPYLTALRKSIEEMNHEKLSNVIKPQKDGKINFQDYYCIVNLVDCIDEETGELTQTKELSMLGSQTVVCRKDEILISGLQPQKGKILIVDNSTQGCIASSEFFPFKITSSKVSPEYLKIILRSNIVSKQWEYQLTGCTPSRARIGENDILDTLIPLIDNPDKLVSEISNIKNKIIDYRNQSNQLKDEAKKCYVINLLGEEKWNQICNNFPSNLNYT